MSDRLTRRHRCRCHPQGQNKTYYHVKDIAYLQHEPLLKKARELYAYEKKVKRARAKKNADLAARLLARKPTYCLDHLVKERCGEVVLRCDRGGVGGAGGGRDGGAKGIAYSLHPLFGILGIPPSPVGGGPCTLLSPCPSPVPLLASLLLLHRTTPAAGTRRSPTPCATSTTR